MSIAKSIAIKLPYKAARTLNRAFGLGITQDAFLVRNALDKARKSISDVDEDSDLFGRRIQIAEDRLNTYRGEFEEDFRTYLRDIKKRRRETLRDNGDYGTTSAY